MAASQITAATRPTKAAGLLIYDGDCGFCTQTARRFSDLAGESASIAPWQALDLTEYGLTEEDVAEAAYFVIDGRSYSGADAFAAGLQSCRGIWRLAGNVFAVPPAMWVARALYPIVAKNRHKLPGATDACRLDL